HAAELEEHADEVRLPLRQQLGHVLGGAPDLARAQVLAVEHLLRLDQLGVELRQRQRRRQDGVLDVEQAVIATGEAAPLRVPGLGAGIRRVDADVHHLGDLGAPLAHDAEALPVPAGVGDDVDGDVDADGARELERLEVLREADALAELPEAILVDRLDAEEHDLEADAGPEPEDLLVPEQHVAARLDVVPLLDATAGDGLADRHAVLGLDEGDVVEDEEARLADARHFLDGALGCLHAVAATVERPGAAEGAVPGAAAAE